MYRYRVFLSYLREDSELAKSIMKTLRSLGLDPKWDEDLTAGWRFADEIKGLIERSHLFIALLTKTSVKRPWVHEETGYAMAWDIPVLPLAIDKQLPGEMMRDLHTLVVKPDLSDLRLRLKEAGIDRLVRNVREKGRARFDCAIHPETRTQMLAEWANFVYQLAGPCRLRQLGALSSFCIPDKHWSDPIWHERDHGLPRTDYYHELQWNERKALQRHALEAGCDLIIDPAIPYSPDGQRARKSRLSILLDFLLKAEDQRSPEAEINIAIVPGEIARGESTTLVGDWFLAQSMSPNPGRGYRNTIFTWHAPRVLYEVERYDQSFKKYHELYGVSLEQAASGVQEIIETIQM